MNYADTLHYLYEQLPMFSRQGAAAYKKDLTNIRALCEHLGNPQERFKCIHVGGTNGKGSVSHMLAAVLQTSGYKTGLYTSPHLYDFRERIRINGEVVTEDFVVSFVETIRPLASEISPSFFEITVAMAFEWFARQQVDIAVIEVGLGGRLDSTNIIHPLLSVITNIGWDHMNLLGDSLEAIAGEKAGIIKPATPVVIGQRQAATDGVFQQAAAREGAPLFFAEDYYLTKHYTWKDDILVLGVVNVEKVEETHYFLDLTGIYQAKNIVSVLTAVDILRDRYHLAISEAHVKKALYNSKKLTGLMGRWEVLYNRPAVVLEVAHNKEGIEQLLLHLRRQHYKNVHFILGMVRDKDTGSVLRLFPSEARFTFSQAAIPRALPATELQEQAATFGLQGEAISNVNEALRQALSKAGSEDAIVVCGSIFLVAEVDKAGFSRWVAQSASAAGSGQ